jgi:CheY-like chemotaxis protein
MAKSVLIVEDNEHLRQILASILGFSGYEIFEVGTGIQAIEKALAAKPKLILLDLDLPDMTGIATAKAIKKNSTTAGICLQRLDYERIERRGAPRRNGRLLTETNPVETHQSKDRRIYPALNNAEVKR